MPLSADDIWSKIICSFLNNTEAQEMRRPTSRQTHALIVASVEPEKTVFLACAGAASHQ